MKTIFGLENFKPNRYRRPFIISVGNFDGVHRAHQAIIKRVVRGAKKLKGTSIILTFNPHPLTVIAPQKRPLLLTSLDHRLKLISSLSPDLCLVVRFNKKLSLLWPREFAKKIFKSKLGIAKIIVGEKFNFGRNKLGDINLLQKIGKILNFEVEILPRLVENKQIISSSLIRHYVKRGKLKEASLMLGRVFSVLGTVENGKRRGHKLGFPTANINPHQESLPPRGVYAVKVKINNRFFKGMLNIGKRPTFSPQAKETVIEVHVFNFKRNIYYQPIEVFFVKKIREEHRFRDTEQLKRQLKKDKQIIQRLLQ